MLCGDLNVDSLKYHKVNIANDNICNSINNEYDRMLNLFRINDLELENVYYGHHGKFPVTYGEVCHLTGYSDSVLTHKEDVGVMQNLDYIFQIQPSFANETVITENNELSDKKENLNKHIKIKDKSAMIEKLLIRELELDKKPRQFSQLSDHYGISISLIVNEQGNTYDNNDNSMSNTMITTIDYSSS